tara:strand:- start:6464 stop:6958 length:495 start_codon:yes stop_codon:yes gene_type:complete
LTDLKEIKNKVIKKENFYFLVIILLIFSIDRYSKIEIINNYSNQSLYLNDFVNLNLIWNTGIGFGILSSSSSMIYNFISFLIFGVIILLGYYYFQSDKNEKFIFSIIIGGAIGNFYDRFFFKAVPDFIDLHFKGFHWFTFNFADVFITIGIIAFLVKGFFIKNN